MVDGIGTGAAAVGLVSMVEGGQAVVGGDPTTWPAEMGEANDGDVVDAL